MEVVDDIYLILPSTTNLSFWVNLRFNMVSEQKVQGDPVFKPLHCRFLPN